MRHVPLFLFYLIFYACGRFHIFATGYQFGIFLNAIGFPLSVISVLLYLHITFKDTKILRPILFLIPVSLVLPCILYSIFDYRIAIISSCLLTYVLFFLSVLRVNILIGYRSITEKVIWFYYLLYTIIAACFYAYCQYLSYNNYSYIELVNGWGIVLAKSAAQRNSDFVYHLQNLTIPILIFGITLFITGKIENNKTALISLFSKWEKKCNFLLEKKDL